MGKDYSWADEREKAAEAFGGRYPDAELEAELIEVFRERPAFVVDAIADVTNGFKAGRIKSPWPFLRKRVGEAPSELRVVDGSEREKRIINTEAWLRIAGLYYDRESEVEDELFGDVGRLRDYAADKALRARLLALWATLRPQGEELERVAVLRIREQMKALERAEGTLAKRRPFAGFHKPEDADWVGDEPPVTAGVE